MLLIAPSSAGKRNTIPGLPGGCSFLSLYFSGVLSVYNDELYADHFVDAEHYASVKHAIKTWPSGYSCARRCGLALMMPNWACRPSDAALHGDVACCIECRRPIYSIRTQLPCIMSQSSARRSFDSPDRDAWLDRCLVTPAKVRPTGLVLAPSATGKSTFVRMQRDPIIYHDGDSIIAQLLGWPSEPNWWTCAEAPLYHAAHARVLRRWLEVVSGVVLFNGDLDILNSASVIGCVIPTISELDANAAARARSAEGRHRTYHPDHERNERTLASYRAAAERYSWHVWPSLSQFDADLRAVMERRS